MYREKVYICSDCQTIFKKDCFLKMENDCPIEQCNGYIKQVDKNMINVFVTLNKKGYIVDECSEGNAFDFINDLLIIEFENQYEFKTLPEGFDKLYTAFYKALVPKECIEDMTYIERQREYLKLYANLLKWAENLPPNEILSKSA